MNDAKEHAEALVDKNEVLSDQSHTKGLMKVTDEISEKENGDLLTTLTTCSTILFQEQMVELNKLYEEIFFDVK